MISVACALKSVLYCIHIEVCIDQIDCGICGGAKLIVLLNIKYI